MGLYVLDVMIWILGIRAHIPQHDDFGAGRGGSSLVGANRLLRVLCAFVVAVALLALALWLAVWVAIRLL